MRYRSIPVAPATIVRTKRSWPGTSTTESAPPAGQHERREPELDRHAARVLLGQAVGVDAGQRAHERRLAVVDVAGGPERQGRGCGAHGRDGAHRARPPRAPRRRSACAGRAAAGRRAMPADHRRIAGAQRGGERGRRRPGRGRSRPPGPAARAAAARRRRRAPSTSTTPPPVASRELVARAGAASPSSASSIASTGSARRAAPGRGAARASPRARRARACRSAPRARADGGGTRRPPSRVPTSSPACGPPSSLSPENVVERGAGADRAAHRRLAGEQLEVVGRARRSRRRRSTGTPRSQSASISTSSTKPTVRKFDGCARRIAPTRSPPAASAAS